MGTHLDGIDINLALNGSDKFNEGMDKAVDKTGKLIKVIDQTAEATNKASTAQQNFVARLDKLTATYGYSKASVIEYDAAQLNLTERLAGQIATFKALESQAKTSAEERKRWAADERELARMQKEEDRAKLKAYNDEIKLIEAMIAAEDKLIASQAKLTKARMEAASINDYEARHKANQQAIKDAEDLANAKAKAAKDAIAYAEKQSIEEINYANKTLREKIRILKEIEQYQAKGVSGETISNKFGSSAVRDVGNLNAHTTALLANEKAARSAHGSATSLSDAWDKVSLSSSRARSEIIVVAHEMLQGRFSRVGPSMLVFAEYSNLSALATFGLGAALLVATGAAVAFGYALFKGAKEAEQMNAALIQTGGYAGVTAEGLNEVAHKAVEAGGSLREAKKAVTELAATGKYTSEQIGLITESAVLMEHAGGQSVEETIKGFEKLAVSVKDHSATASRAIGDAAVKMDASNHFLTLGVYAEIAALEKSGEYKKASAVATEQLAKVTKERAAEMAASLGFVSREWNLITERANKALDAVLNWGKPATIKDLAKEYTKLKEEASKPYDPKNIQQTADHTNRVQKLTEAYGLLREAATKKVNAAETGIDAKTQTEAVSALQRINEIVFSTKKKSIENASTAIQEYGNQLKLIAAFKPVTEQDKKAKDAALDQTTVDKNVKQIQSYWAERNKAAKEGSTLEYNIQTLAFDSENRRREQDFGESLKSSNKIFANKKLALETEFEITRKGAERIEGVHVLQASDYNQYVGKIIALNQQQLDANNAFIDADINARAIAVNQLLADSNEEVRITGHGQDQLKLKQAGIIEDFSKYVNSKLDLKKSLQVTNDADNEKAELNNLTKLSEGYQKTIDVLDKQVESLRVQDRALGKSAVQIADLQKAEDLATISKLAGIRAISTASLATAKTDGDKSRYAEEIRQLDLIMGKYQEKSKLEASIADKNKPIAAALALTKALNSNVEAAKAFEASMSSAFGSTGKAIGSAIVSMAEFAKLQNQIAEDKKKALSNVSADADPKVAIAIEKEANDKLTSAKIENLSKVIGATKSFFSEGSRGYKAMEAAEKTLQAIQLARTIAQLFGIGVTSAAGTAASQKSILESAAAFIKSAAGAIAKAGEQSGWYGAAAMAAVMAGLGYATGAFGSSGSGGQSAADAQKTQGTGGVFGDVQAKSDSIQKSIEMMSKNTSILLPINQGMLRSLQNIEAAMVGLGTIISRTTGIANGDNLGIKTGQQGLGGSVTDKMDQRITSATFGSNSFVTKIATALGNFWGKTTQTIVDAGVQFGGKLTDLQAGRGFSQYASVDTKTTKAFGLIKNTSNAVTTQGLNPELTQQFSLIFSGVGDALKLAGVALGKSGKTVTDILNNLTIDTTKISLKGLTGKALSDALNTVISKATDQMAMAVFPELTAFRQVGEGYVQTVIRVATGVESAGSVLDQLGIQAIDYTKILNKQADVGGEIVRESIMAVEGLSGVGKILGDLSGSATELATAYKGLLDIRKLMRASLGAGKDMLLNVDIIRGAGGQSQLSDGLKTYGDKFFTTDEKNKAATKELNSEFVKLGVAMPRTRDEFKKLINSLDLTTPAGSKLFGSLMLLAGGFDTVTSASEAAAQKLLDDAKKLADQSRSLDIQLMTALGDDAGATAATREDVLANLDPSLRGKQQAVWNAQDAKIAADKAKAAANDQQSAANSASQAASQVVQAWQSVTDAIIGEVKRIRGVVEESNGTSYAQLQSRFAITTANARSGNQTAAGDLPAISQALLTMAETQATSLEELNTIRSMTANSLEETANIFKKYGVTIPAFASGGDHAGGVRLVGEHGPEIEVTGSSRIFSAGQTSSILSGSGGDTVAEISKLRQEVRDLNAALISIAISSDKMSRSIVRNDSGNGYYTTPALP